MTAFWVGWAMGVGSAAWWFVGLPWLAERLGVWDRRIAPRDDEAAR